MTDAPTPASRAATWISWAARAVAALALLVVVWALLTSWGGVWHSHPAYAVLLILTALGALGGLALSALRAPRPGRARSVWRVVGVVSALVWVGLVAWLRPFSATEPSVAAMESDALVSVTESATTIVLAPASGVSGDVTALAFQPGARVDPRAYVAMLRPLAEAGHAVVIVKQPLGIAFLALDGLDTASDTVPEPTTWALGGHSLGGTVAALEAQAERTDDGLLGLVLFASYPAGDMSDFEGAVQSISGSQDGLSTPAKIEASRADLPAGSAFVEIEGASHAQFGDYGVQPGDGDPSISDADAREQITAAALDFMDSLDALG